MISKMLKGAGVGDKILLDMFSEDMVLKFKPKIEKFLRELDEYLGDDNKMVMLRKITGEVDGQKVSDIRLFFVDVDKIERFEIKGSPDSVSVTTTIEKVMESGDLESLTELADVFSFSEKKE